jgi:hypothetical protein
MRDALTGALMLDGWEPVPFSSAMASRQGLLDASQFQDKAAAHGLDAGWVSGIAHVALPQDGDYVTILPQEFPLRSLRTTPIWRRLLRECF